MTGKWRTGETDGGGMTSPAWITRVLSREYLAGATVDIQGDSSSTPEIYAGVQLTGAGHQFLAWWQEARGADPIPAANAVSPRALRQILPYIRYMSWAGPEQLIFRIYGSALAEATGFDLTGVDLFGLGDYPTRQLDIARLKALHEMPCGVIMQREMRGFDGSTNICELVTLPIAPAADGNPRLIGTIVPVEVQEDIWTKKLRMDLEPELKRAVFIDTGHGVPDPLLGMEC
ncbi:MAG: hypothetical protein CMI59_16485 [Parvibaculum sp.]|nr:hypothetical protein [Parvibaculum sp.]